MNLNTAPKYEFKQKSIRQPRTKPWLRIQLSIIFFKKWLMFLKRVEVDIRCECLNPECFSKVDKGLHCSSNWSLYYHFRRAICYPWYKLRNVSYSFLKIVKESFFVVCVLFTILHITDTAECLIGTWHYKI